MKFIKKYSSKGINQHTTYLYRKGNRFAGIDKNHDVYLNPESEKPGAFYCFEIIDNFSHGEGHDTIWYETHAAALEIVKQYLSGEIDHIPTKGGE